MKSPKLTKTAPNMDKFYQDSFTTLYHGDCEEIIKHLPKVDLIVTSPPYNLNNTSGSEWSRLSNGYESSLDNLDFDTYKVWHKKIISLNWDRDWETEVLFRL